MGEKILGAKFEYKTLRWKACECDGWVGGIKCAEIKAWYGQKRGLGAPDGDSAGNSFGATSGV